MAYTQLLFCFKLLHCASIHRHEASLFGHNSHEMIVTSFYSYSAHTVSSKQRKVSLLMFKDRLLEQAVKRGVFSPPFRKGKE